MTDQQRETARTRAKIMGALLAATLANQDSGETVTADQLDRAASNADAIIARARKGIARLDRTDAP